MAPQCLVNFKPQARGRFLKDFIIMTSFSRILAGGLIGLGVAAGG
jgi:hypothetical protein